MESNKKCVIDEKIPTCFIDGKITDLNEMLLTDLKKLKSRIEVKEEKIRKKINKELNKY